MAKLSYNGAIALFSVFLVASMMSGAAGQETCHDVLTAPGNGVCDAQICQEKCSSKYGSTATGWCVNSYGNLLSCNCSWPCQRQ